MSVAGLTANQELILEVLAARHRLGESCWTFPARMTASINGLGRRGLVDSKSGVVGRTVLAWLTEKGIKAATSDTYTPPKPPSAAPAMSPEEEAHWRYQLEIMTSWQYHDRMINQDNWNKVPPEVAWLREEARYKGHLATVHLRHTAAAQGKEVM